MANAYYSVTLVETDSRREIGGIHMISGKHKIARFDGDKSLSIFCMCSTAFEKSSKNLFITGTSPVF